MTTNAAKHFMDTIITSQMCVFYPIMIIYFHVLVTTLLNCGKLVLVFVNVHLLDMKIGFELLQLAKMAKLLLVVPVINP